MKRYEVKLQKGLDCGGAYVKLLSKDDTKEQYDPLTFDDKAPYTIMFGPDRCGGTNKVRHQHMVHMRTGIYSNVVE